MISSTEEGASAAMMKRVRSAGLSMGVGVLVGTPVVRMIVGRVVLEKWVGVGKVTFARRVVAVGRVRFPLGRVVFHWWDEVGWRESSIDVVMMLG